MYIKFPGTVVAESNGSDKKSKNCGIFSVQ